MKVYRIKHKLTGLYYQPIKGRFEKEKTNLGPNGKVYIFRKPSFDHIGSIISISLSICKKYNIEWSKYFRFCRDDFEIIEYKCEEIKGE